MPRPVKGASKALYNNLWREITPSLWYNDHQKRWRAYAYVHMGQRKLSLGTFTRRADATKRVSEYIRDNPAARKRSDYT